MKSGTNAEDMNQYLKTSLKPQPTFVCQKDMFFQLDGFFFPPNNNLFVDDGVACCKVRRLFQALGR